MLLLNLKGIGLIIPLQRSMREPEKFPKVLKKSMFIIFTAMFIVGGLSYYIFGDEVNFNLNIKKKLYIKIQINH